MNAPNLLIQEQLDRIEHMLKKSSYGFREEGNKRTVVFCNRTNDCLWYKLDHGVDPAVVVPILQGSLKCQLEGIAIRTVVRDDKETRKFTLYVEGDQPYALESGWSTALKEASFAKSLVRTIAGMTIEQLMQPVTLQPVIGTSKKKTLFCRVFQNDESIFIPNEEGTDWDDVLQQAIANLEEATGRNFREKEEAEVPEPETSDPIDSPVSSSVMPEPVSRVRTIDQEPSELPIQDAVKIMIDDIDSIEKAYAFYGWLTQEGNWKQVSFLPGVGEGIKRRLAEKIVANTSTDLRAIQSDVKTELDYLNWTPIQIESKLVKKYKKREYTQLSQSESYLFFWSLQLQPNSYYRSQLDDQG